jgi:hypothetical protein
MAKSRKRPPQGTTSIVGGKQEALAETFGADLAAATVLSVRDPDMNALAQAKRSRDTAAMGRLIPVLRERYGEKDFSRMFKAL